MGNIYIAENGPELSTLTGFYDSQGLTADDISRTEAQVKTSVALALLADGQSGKKHYAPHLQHKTIELLAKQPGWRIIRWGWSSHAETKDDETNYRLYLFGKAFEKPAGSARYSTPMFGCSFHGYSTQLALKGHNATQYGYKGRTELYAYNGPPLSAADYEAVRPVGWRRIRGTQLLVLGRHPRDLSAAEKQRLGLEDA